MDNLPPRSITMPFPVMTGIVIAVIATAILLVVVGKFDPTGGPLTLSILITLTVMAVIALSVLYTIPSDETTSLVIGALVGAFGATVGYWLTRRDGQK